MIDTAINLAELPWATVLTLAAGYCGYFIAHQGVRNHHRTADVTFGTLAFGFWGLLVFQFLSTMPSPGINVTWASIAGFVTSIAMGGLWAKWGRKNLIVLLREMKISLIDDCPSAWASLGRDPGAVSSQLTVKTVSGMVYHCDDLDHFSDFPNGPCTLGAAGDVLMYVTHSKRQGETDFTKRKDLESSAWGAAILFLPKEQILWVKLRQQ